MNGKNITPELIFHCYVNSAICFFKLGDSLRAVNYFEHSLLALKAYKKKLADRLPLKNLASAKFQESISNKMKIKKIKLNIHKQLTVIYSELLQYNF